MLEQDISVLIISVVDKLEEKQARGDLLPAVESRLKVLRKGFPPITDRSSLRLHRLPQSS